MDDGDAAAHADEELALDGATEGRQWPALGAVQEDVARSRRRSSANRPKSLRIGLPSATSVTRTEVRSSARRRERTSPSVPRATPLPPPDDASRTLGEGFRLFASGDFANAEKHYLKDALEAVLAGVPHRIETTAPYEPRDFCVQYRETDFNFASRLMEEEGIFYFFKHEDGGTGPRWAERFASFFS